MADICYRYGCFGHREAAYTNPKRISEDLTTPWDTYREWLHNNILMLSGPTSVNGLNLNLVETLNQMVNPVEFDLIPQLSAL